MAIIPAEEKVFMVSNSTNTTYSGSAALKAMQQWYTMEDVTNTVRPYQVFTALLTQSGGDNPGTFQNLDNGDLVIGVTYEIAFYETGDDFTNIGAPTNANGVKFVATGTTAANWNGATELNYNTGAPVATVLENTIGNIWFTYTGVGQYNCNSNSLFTENKSWVNPVILLGVNGPASRGVTYFNTENLIGIITESDIDSPSNDLLANTPIEIRVYN